MRGEGAARLQVGSRVVMRSICVGAWSIPGATEVLSVITMARKLAVKTNCIPHPLSLHLLQGLDLRLPTRLRKTGTSLQMPLAAACGQRSRVERRGEEQRGTKAQKELCVWSTCGQENFVPCHCVVLSLNRRDSFAAQKDVSICKTRFVATLPKVINLMSSWPCRAIPLGQH